MDYQIAFFENIGISDVLVKLSQVMDKSRILFSTIIQFIRK